MTSRPNFNGGFLCAELRRALGGQVPVTRGPGFLPGYVNGLRNLAWVRARSADDVAATLAVCNRLGAVVAPCGGGTHMHLGRPFKVWHQRPPEMHNMVDVLLDMREFQGVIEYRPDDLTLAVAAGTRFRVIQQVLAEFGQMLALDPLVDASSTIGGIVATNRSGPRRAGSGTARDHIIGMEVAGVDGSITKSGGMVVKNVTGYDLSKAHIGALGTLGIITRVNLKTVPIPAVESTLVIPMPDPDSAVRLVGALTNLPLIFSGLDLVQQQLLPDMNLDRSWVLAIRIPGTEAGVREKLVMVREVVDLEAGDTPIELQGAEQKRFWRDADMLARPKIPVEEWYACPPARLKILLARLSSDLASKVPTICCMSGLPTQVASMLGTAKEVGDDLGLSTVSSARAFNGVVRVSVPSQSPVSLVAEFVQQLRTAIQKLEGSLIVESSHSVVKQSVGVWGMQPDSSALKAMAALRTSFDPTRIINRGRYVVS